MPIFKRFTGLRRERGASLVGVMLIGASLNLAIVLGYSYFEGLTNQALRNGNVLQYNLALQGLVDYSVYGIKRRWCFDAIMLQESVCDLTNDGNTERLLLSNDTVNQILARNPPIAHGTPVRLTRIERVVNMNLVTNSHPLYRIVQALRASFYDETQKKVSSALSDNLTFTMERIDSAKFPARGRETYLKVTVSASVLGGFGFVAGSRIYADAIIAIIPREVGAMALSVTNDLHLDAQIASPSTGDVYFPLFPSRAAASADTSPGLVFGGPVYVNGNLVLPSSTTPNAYSPVTFNDVVYLGLGVIMRDGKPARPSTSGGATDQFNDQISSIGGLRKGVLVEGERDIGLDVFAGLSTGNNPDSSLMTACIERNKALSDLRATKNSALLVRSRAPATAAGSDKVFQYKLGLSQGNIFRPRGTVEISSTNSPPQTWKNTSLSNSGSPSAWMELRVNFPSGNSYTTALVGNDSEVTLYPVFPGASCGSFDNLDVRNQNCPVGQAGVRSSYCGAGGTMVSVVNSCVTAPGPVLKSCGGGIKEGQLRNVACPAGSQGQKVERCDGPNFSPVIDTCRPYAELAVKVSPTMVGGHAQDNQLNLDVTFRNQGTFSEAPKITLTAYELGTRGSDGSTRRSVGVGTAEANNGQGFFIQDRVAQVEYSLSGGVVSSPAEFDAGPFVVGDTYNRTNYPSVYNAPSESVDYIDLAAKCNGSGGPGGASFGLADWDYNFAPVTRASWNFAEPSASFVLNQNNAKDPPVTPGDLQFLVKSIVGECRVAADANFVAGFFTCDEFIIDPRSTPLKIIGSVIANRVRIDPSAMTAGIEWNNIHNPRSVQELRRVGILSPLPGGSCDMSSSPAWNPFPNVLEQASLRRCSAAYLRERANPFTWSTVDPDCGLVTGSPSTTCKGRVRRYNVQEILRGGSL